MSHVYVAGWCDMPTLEAEQDDPSLAEDLLTMATPQVGLVGLSFTPAFVEKASERCYAEAVDYMNEDCEEDDKEEFTWGELYHFEAKDGRREYWTRTLKYAHTTEAFALLVIQKVEIEQ